MLLLATNLVSNVFNWSYVTSGLDVKYRVVPRAFLASIFNIFKQYLEGALTGVDVVTYE